MDPKTRKIYLNEINTMPGFTVDQHVSQTVGRRPAWPTPI